MKTLNNHLLLYDKDCPLCCWYTQLFVKYNMLNKKGRVAYQDVDQSKYSQVDFIKAQNKIALINTEKQQVIYGIDAIVILLSIPFPFIGFTMRFKPLHWLMEKLYLFISMNRKIIIPVNCNNATSCTPSKNWFWRWIFIIFCAITVNLIVGQYFIKHLPSFFIGNPLYGDSIYFGVQLLFQYIMCLLFNEKNYYDYLGQISFVSLLGAFALGIFGIGLSFLNYFNINITMLQPFCYGMVFLWMFLEHRRRITISNMDWRLSYTWVFIRLVMYPFAFTI